jgi:hypothetical protein
LPFIVGKRKDHLAEGCEPSDALMPPFPVH